MSGAGERQDSQSTETYMLINVMWSIGWNFYSNVITDNKSDQKVLFRTFVCTPTTPLEPPQSLNVVRCRANRQENKCHRNTESSFREAATADHQASAAIFLLCRTRQQQINSDKSVRGISAVSSGTPNSLPR